MAGVVARRHFGKAAPAAADFNNARAGQRRKPLEDAPVLGLLRLLQRALRRGFEQRARISHRRIEPELVKVIAKVVMRGDVALAAAARIAVQEVLEAVNQAAPETTVECALYRITVARQQRQQNGRVGARPVAAQIGLGKRGVPAGHGFAKYAPIVHRQAGCGRAGSKLQVTPVGQADRKGTMRNALEQPEHGARGKRQQAEVKSVYRHYRLRRKCGTPGASGAIGRGDGTVHRLTSSAGGTGLEKNGTRLPHKRAACQWMRNTTSRVIHG